MSVSFTDTFVVSAVDVDPATNEKKKHFDKVSRIEGKGENYNMHITLDVNTEVYPVAESDRVEILLTEQLRQEADDTDADASYDPTIPLGELADTYEYIMHGRIFKFAETKNTAVLYMSFGGLLMALTGEPRSLNSYTYKVDSPVFLFMRKM